MSLTETVRSPAEYEERLQKYLYERSEEGRAVRVGEKETSEQAAIVARYDDLFSRAQLASLRECEEQAPDGDERERLYRLRKTCEGGLAAAELAEAEDEFQNKVLAARVTWKGEEMPLRSAQAKLAVLDSYADRAELGAIAGGRVGNVQRGTRGAAGQGRGARGGADRGARERRAQRGGEAGVAARARADARRGERRRRRALGRAAPRWFDRLLGTDRDDVPASFHSGYMRRLSPLQSTYTKERSVEICMDTLRNLGFDMENDENIRLDLDDRPQKSPRACVIASDPPKVVHLITRAQGGLHDYQAFLHEAGHALHFAGCDPSLPYAFRRLARDHALTEIYSYILEAITREPAWHAAYFGLSDEVAAGNAEATHFFETLLFRRYVAKLQYELDFWSRYNDVGAKPDGYADRLTSAVGLRYREDGYLSDMDAGFYSADYLRAWIRSAQLRAFLRRELGEDWWRNAETGDRLRALFFEGTRPSSEEIAGRLGFEPLDTGPLVSELTA